MWWSTENGVIAEKTKAVLEKAKTVLPSIASLDEHAASEVFRAEAEAMGVKLGDFMMPMRMAITGSRISPPLVGSIQILGIDRSIARIEKTLKERFNFGCWYDAASLTAKLGRCL